MKIKRLLCLLLAAVMLLALCACGSAAPTPAANEDAPVGETAPEAAEPAAEAASAGTEARVLRIGTTEATNTFNPFLGSAGSANYLAFETIVLRTEEGYVPWLLTDYEWEDGTTLVMHVRDDVCFTNGEQMLGEDIVYAFQQNAQNPASPTASHFACIDFDATTVSDDGLTVTMKLSQEYGPLEAFFDIVYIVDKSECESWASDDSRWWDAPVTTSAYEIAENISGSHVTFKLRDDYWNKDNMPDWDEVTFQTYSDKTAMFIAFESGDIDMVLGVDAKDYSRLESGDVKNASTVSYGLISSNANYMLAFDNNRAEFQDPKVREAINYCIDRAGIGEVVYSGQYDIPTSVICPATKYYKNVGSYDVYDLDRAKQCMAESNYPDGFHLNIVCNSADAPIWDVLQICLAEIGITCDIAAYDLVTMIPYWMQPGGTDCVVCTCSGGNIVGEPYADISSHWKNGMFVAGRVLDAEYNEHFEHFVYSTDEAVRNEECAWIQQWLHDNNEVLPLVSPSYGYCYRTNIVGEVSILSAVRANPLLCKAAN